MKRIFLGIALLSLASAASAVPIEGRWKNPKDSVIIDVAPCGAGTWCGKVSWASPKARGGRAEGRHHEPGRNAAADRAASPTAEGSCKGRVYLPKRNMHANATIRTAGSDAMVVKGCAVGGMICKEQRWTRVS